MARQIYAFAPTITAHTPIAAPLTLKMTMPSRIVRSLNILVPPGPQGFMGFRISYSGQQIIPFNTGQWLTTDHESFDWPLEGFPDTGAWTLDGYNTGNYDHTVYCRFLVDLVADPVSPGIATLPNNALSST